MSPMLMLTRGATPGGWATLALTIFLVAILSPPAAAQAERALAFVGATLIDGTGAAPLEDAVLLIDGERIVEVGPRAEVAIPTRAEQVDVRGRWIIPGLIDAHVHFFQSGGLYTRPDVIDLRRVRPYETEIRMIQETLPETLARYVASGVTGVVDMGGPMWNFQLRARAQALEAAPRVAVAGPLLGTYAPPELQTGDPPILEIGSPERARAEVRRQLAQDPDLVKIWFVRPGADIEGELEWVRAVIEASHAAGVPAVAHATQLRVARAMVEAGVDILAHSIDDEPIDQAMLELMRERGVIYTTTLMVGPRYRALFARNLELSAFEERLADPEVIATLDELARVQLRGTASGAQRLDAVAADNLVRVHEAGITIAAGSDAGNIGTLHGPSLHHELALMAEAGLAPMDVLRAATSGGAAVMGRTDDLGTLEPGKLADLLVLEADPLADIRNTRAISRVVKGGRIFRPDEVIEPAAQE